MVILGMRALPRFGGPAVDFSTFPYAGTAAEALDQLDEAYRLWSDGVEALGTDGLTLPAHPDEPAYDGWATASIVLHVQRELLHHGAEIALLRDLYRASGSE